LAGPSNPTIKRLFAMSHNLCAFPGCREPLVEGETVVGDVCHVKGDRLGSARYDADQSDAERHGYENLIVLCRKHHRIIDNEEAEYPVERLLKIKKEHEESDSRRYDISDKLVQRLGEILTTGSENGSRTSRVAYPDWTIRELFFRIRPDLLEEPQEERWAAVGREVMDHFSTGRLKVWGRPMNRVGRQGPMKAVDEPGYWARAEFSYRFLAEDGRKKAHTWVKTETGLPDYADLQVNREEALRIWPEPGKSSDDRTEIMLLDAARRAYSETRGLPAAEHTEMDGNSPEEILKWYCVWIAMRMQLYGVRHPSTKVEPMSIDNPAKDFNLQDDTLTLRERYGNVVWENLRVKLADLSEVIHDLKGLGRE
jgi:hypothetical protein